MQLLLQSVTALGLEHKEESMEYKEATFCLLEDTYVFINCYNSVDIAKKMRALSNFLLLQPSWNCFSRALSSLRKGKNELIKYSRQFLKCLLIVSNG